MKSITRLLLALLMVAASPAALSQKYPSRPLRVISPDAPGSNMDVIARLVGQELGDHLGQTVVIENRPGAGGIIGTEAVAKAAPDGHTLLMVTAYAVVVNPFLYDRLPYNPDTDLAPVSLLGTAPFALFVSSTSGVNSFAELLARVKSNPGKTNGGTATQGSLLHLTLESVRRSTGMEFTYVSYKGSTAAGTALVQGEIDLLVDTFTPMMPFLKAGRIRPLAVSSLRRVAMAPDVPTLDELGLKGFDANGWAGVFVPARTPKDVRDTLEAAFAKVVASPKIRERFDSLSWAASGAGSNELAALIRSDRERWGPVVKSLGLRIQ